MPREGYMTFSVKSEIYDKMRRDWDSLVKSNTDKSFTHWVTDCVEAAMTREKYLAKTFPKLSVIFYEQGRMIIKDAEKNAVIEITMTKSGITCTAKESRDQYVLYASLSPLFSI